MLGGGGPMGHDYYEVSEAYHTLGGCAVGYVGRLHTLVDSETTPL